MTITDDYIEQACDDLKDALDTLLSNADDESYQRAIDELRYISSMIDEFPSGQ